MYLIFVLQDIVLRLQGIPSRYVNVEALMERGNQVLGLEFGVGQDTGSPQFPELFFLSFT